MLHMVHNSMLRTSQVMHLTTSTPSRSSPSSFARSSVYCSVSFSSLAEMRTSTACMPDNKLLLFLNCLAEILTSIGYTCQTAKFLFHFFFFNSFEMCTSTAYMSRRQIASHCPSCRDVHPYSLHVQTAFYSFTSAVLQRCTAIHRSTVPKTSTLYIQPTSSSISIASPDYNAM